MKFEESYFFFYDHCQNLNVWYQAKHANQMPNDSAIVSFECEGFSNKAFELIKQI